MTGCVRNAAGLLALVLAGGAGSAPIHGAQEVRDASRPAGAATAAKSASPTTPPPSTESATLSPADLVRIGNERFLAGQIDEALRRYESARQLKPDSEALAFNLGLAHLKRGEFEQARDELRQAAAGSDPALAADAAYALGLTDHADALKSVEQDPALATQRAQDAIRAYHDVLTTAPSHKGARDAWNKAAALWRQLKEQQQQQQQQPQSGQGNSNDNAGEEEQQSSEQNAPTDPQQKPDQPPSQDPQNADDQQQQNDNSDSASQSAESRQPAPEDAENRSESQGSESETPQDDKQQKQQPQPKPAEEEDKKQSAEPQDSGVEEQTAARDAEQGEASRDQAARELRRLMDRQRLNEQRRRARPQARPAAPPAGKDW